MEFLSRHGIAYTERNLSDDPTAVDELIAMGSQSTPTIKVGDKVMIGFRQKELLSWINPA